MCADKQWREPTITGATCSPLVFVLMCCWTGRRVFETKQKLSHATSAAPSVSEATLTTRVSEPELKTQRTTDQKNVAQREGEHYLQISKTYSHHQAVDHRSAPRWCQLTAQRAMKDSISASSSSPQRLRQSQGWVLEVFTPQFLADLVSLVHLHKLVIHVFLLRSLDAPVDGLTNCVPIFVHKRWSPSIVYHIRSR